MDFAYLILSAGCVLAALTLIAGCARLEQRK